MKNYEQFDFNKIKTYPISGRKNKVSIDDFGKACDANSSFGEWLGSLPDILAAQNLRKLIEAIKNSRQKDRPVVMAIGGHVIKCGLAPIIIDLFKRNLVTAICMNGSAAIHDLEIAINGATSEDVAAVLHEGDFGMAEETGKIYNAAAKNANEQNIGLGKSLAKLAFDEAKPEYQEHSLLCACHELGIPITIHVAMGTDIVHMRAEANGADLGQSTMNDFKLLCSIVADLEEGVWLNCGSAVIMPEVFLKCVSIVKNTGHSINKLTTANLDMIQHYRPSVNVGKRPAGEKGLQITGHHEIMIPLLRMGLICS